MTVDENYTERLVNAVAKTLVEALENLTIADVNMYRLGYTKAIDDICDKAIEWNNQSTKKVPYEFIRWIEKQLKAGGSDG